jgi:O-antigen biosynthesis protein WbqP
MNFLSFQKRCIDIFFSIIGIFLSVPLLIVSIAAITLTSKGNPIHWSKRVGARNKIFLMPKLRTMSIEAPQISTELMSKSGQSHVTPVGRLLRKTSIDEFPQFWSVLVGDMSLVGPRPALFNQENLINLRTKHGVDQLKPGITGWAQINGRDHVSDEEKVQLDLYYLKNLSLALDLKIVFMTFLKVLGQKDVSH